jgi:Tfp pilus assembly protein PilP
MSAQEKSEKAAEKNEQKSLVLKKLLRPSKKSLAPPKRNIFTRQRGNPGAGDFSPSGDFLSPEQASGQKMTPDQKKTAMETDRFNVKYIGYVRSGERVVALILLGSKSYAVESGDILETGLTIGEITPDDIEISSQGSEPQRINLEGEKP